MSVQNRTGLTSQASPPGQRRLGLALLVIATAELGLGALAAIASMVTRSRLEGHAVAAALTDGYVAGLLAGTVLFAAGAVVAICTINARISAAEAAVH